MSGAHSWSLKGIDPKVREAAREAAARQGVSLGEYLNQALTGQQADGDGASQTPAQPGRMRRPPLEQVEGDAAQDWGATSSRAGDPRLDQRIDSIERRMQLAVAGLDRAVSTIDRSVLGLAGRLEDAETTAAQNAERIADALEHFRAATDTLSGRVQRAEATTLDATERLEHQVAAAAEVARRAEAAASFLSNEMQARDAEISQTAAEARALAEEAARQAAEASADAVAELHRLQQQLSQRLSETEHSARRAVESAIAEVRSEAAVETRHTREALLEEVVRLEGEIASRLDGAEGLKAEQAALVARIERAEAAARESTAGLRQAAGAAIADLRNAQLTLAARVNQMEDAAGQSGGADVGDLRRQQQDIAERLAALEQKADPNLVHEALHAFERRLASVEMDTPGGRKFEQVDGAVKTLDQALQRLADRLVETESTANTAIRTLEETVSSLGARMEQSAAVQETEAVRALLEQRLDDMAQSVTQMVGEARHELAGQLQAALDGSLGEGFEGALADVNRRLAAAERRQAQTIEAISLEIMRMSETVDQRLRAVEARNDDAAASAVREELARMAATLEQRFDEIEHREAAAFDRMGLEVGRLSERLEERVGAVESRSAQAIEQVGEQVARMAERFKQRQDLLARELGERMLDSEERAGARVSEAINSIMQRLAEVEEHSAEAIAPVQKAVSSVANKLELFESAQDAGVLSSSRPFDDFPNFGDPAEACEEPYVSPMDAARPLRAGPLPRAESVADEDDIYFAEDIDDELLAPEAPQLFPETPIAFSSDDLLIEDADPQEYATAPPPADDEPFWTPSETSEPTGARDDADIPLASSIAPRDVPLAGMSEPAATDAPDQAGQTTKNDYLANARKAAQAQALPRTRAEPGPTPKLSLRGSSRIVLWGAASLIALLMVGGAWYVKNQDEPTGIAPEPAQPQAARGQASPVHAPPPDPFAEAPAEGLAPDAGATDSAPIAQNEAEHQVVAGPLAPRNLSLEQSAEQGDLIAQYELGLQRLAARRTQEGVALLRRAADRGFAMAQYRLAKLYERGEGVPSDLTLARQWTERAAAGGNRRAMHDLGVYYARGEGAAVDDSAAFRWFRQAAELGVADSQYNLGVLYQLGRGVNASPAEALFWFSVAARSGDHDAAARAAALEAQLSPAQIEQARARAQAFRPRAASAVANGEFGQRAWAQRTGT